jgi:predicted TIM-barrel fold metal-dependent hydrolase
MELADIPLIDQHAHNLLKPEIFSQYSYSAAFTEGYDPNIVNYHSRHTLCYRRSLRDIAALLDCEPTETDIIRQRENLGLEKLTQLCFQAANLESILLDDGLLAREILPIAWHEKFLPVYRLLRLETLAETLFETAQSFEAFVNEFRLEIDDRPTGVIGFKSIAAYRTGLRIESVADREAESCFYWLKGLGPYTPDLPFRLQNKCLIDFLLGQALEIAAKQKMPVQFHTGFGDPDLDLLLANPLHLRSLLEDDRYQDVPIVLLHGSYPYTREAAYLASVYPQVYVDFGLAVPFLSVSGMRSTVRMLLELAPTSKVMYSSDAHLIPELYYLGGLWGREILAQVLTSAIADGDLTDPEAEAIAHAILRENAGNLYQI